jgi:hypothetical protein
MHELARGLVGEIAEGVGGAAGYADDIALLGGEARPVGS